MIFQSSTQSNSVTHRVYFEGKENNFFKETIGVLNVILNNVDRMGVLTRGSRGSCSTEEIATAIEILKDFCETDCIYFTNTYPKIQKKKD